MDKKTGTVGMMDFIPTVPVFLLFVTTFKFHGLVYDVDYQSRATVTPKFLRQSETEQTYGLIKFTYRLALLVFAPVKHSPVYLSGVPFGQESRFAFGIQELEHLIG